MIRNLNIIGNFVREKEIRETPTLNPIWDCKWTLFLNTLDIDNEEIIS